MSTNFCCFLELCACDVFRGFILPHSKPFYAAARFLQWMRQGGLFDG